MSIEFQDTMHIPVRPNNLSKEEKGVVQREIDKLLAEKGIIKNLNMKKEESSLRFFQEKD